MRQVISVITAKSIQRNIFLVEEITPSFLKEVSNKNNTRLHNFAHRLKFSVACEPWAQKWREMNMIGYLRMSVNSKFEQGDGISLISVRFVCRYFFI